MRKRKEHFFKVDLLKSQFKILEEPTDIPHVDISRNPEAIVAIVRKIFGLYLLEKE
jgi:gluconate kinase